MTKSAFIALIPAAVAALSISCGRPARPAPELGWPPQAPVIRYVDSFHGDRDLKRGFFGKIKDFLFGRPAGLAIGKPYGVANDGKSKLYIADTAKKGILVFNVSRGSARFFNSLGAYGTLLEPVYLTLDSEGFVYVSDTEIGRIAVFDPDLRFDRFIGAAGEMIAPVGMTFNKDETELYVVDTRAHDVKVFSREGQLLRTIGRRGDGQGEFFYPTTVAISGNDTVYIVDSFHFAVQAFDLNGNFLFSFGPKATGPGTLARPRDIAIDRDNHLYVTDATRNNVQVFDTRGSLLLAFGTLGIGPGEFQLPAGISITAQNRIYIGDSINERVQIFEYLAPENSEEVQ